MLKLSQQQSQQVQKLTDDRLVQLILKIPANNDKLYPYVASLTDVNPSVEGNGPNNLAPVLVSPRLYTDLSISVTIHRVQLLAYEAILRGDQSFFKALSIRSDYPMFKTHLAIIIKPVDNRPFNFNHYLQWREFTNIDIQKVNDCLTYLADYHSELLSASAKKEIEVLLTKKKTQSFNSTFFQEEIKKYYQNFYYNQNLKISDQEKENLVADFNELPKPFVKLSELYGEFIYHFTSSTGEEGPLPTPYSLDSDAFNKSADFNILKDKLDENLGQMSVRKKKDKLNQVLEEIAYYQNPINLKFILKANSADLIILQLLNNTENLLLNVVIKNLSLMLLYPHDVSFTYRGMEYTWLSLDERIKLFHILQGAFRIAQDQQKIQQLSKNQAGQSIEFADKKMLKEIQTSVAVPLEKYIGELEVTIDDHQRGIEKLQAEHDTLQQKYDTLDRSYQELVGKHVNLEKLVNELTRIVAELQVKNQVIEVSSVSAVNNPAFLK